MMKHFTITKDSLNLLVSDLKRFTAIFEGSERILHDSKSPIFHNSYMDTNKIYITRDFEVLFKRIMETLDYIQKVEIEKAPPKISGVEDRVRAVPLEEE